MQYWNGSQWVFLQIGTQGQTLTVCNGKPNWGPCSVVLATLTTSTITNITSSTATSGGNISNDGGGSITARGVCWSTSQSPTIALSTKTVDGTGIGTFTSNLTGLNTATTYYVRAYATNSAGTAYGNQQTLTTSTVVNGIFNPNLTYGTIADNDGNTYKTIVIGTQTWMAENLKTSKYRNGDLIPTGLSGSQWSTTSTGAYAIYDNNEANNTTYGKLYNWYAVIDSRNLCPAGLHVPSDAEWTTLENYLGGSTVAGGKMKSTSLSYWQTPNTEATNESGFSGLPGGDRPAGGNNIYYLFGYNGLWWSSTVGSITQAYARYLKNTNGNSLRTNTQQRNGFSVRCLMD